MIAKTKFKTVDEYIASFPKDVKEKLELIRETIRKNTPAATEIISYQMPAYKMNKVLVYFAAYKNHIGFYPTANPIKIFSKELSRFETSKGAVKFPLDKKIPLNLIAKITKYRVKEDSMDKK